MVRIEEREPVASPGGCTLTVQVNKYELTPGGSEKLTKTTSYNYKAELDGESKESRTSRMDVKRNARRRALEKLDPEKHEAAKKKRRKDPRPAQAATPSPLLAAVPQQQLPATALPPVRMTPRTECAAAADEDPEDVATQRDWALLRAWKEQPTAEAVLPCAA
jgi:hypothetical protein